MNNEKNEIVTWMTNPLHAKELAIEIITEILELARLSELRNRISILGTPKYKGKKRKRKLVQDISPQS